jgi:hypothetical protein
MTLSALGHQRNFGYAVEAYADATGQTEYD